MSKKILLIEDDSQLQKMYKQRFVEEGFEVISATGGKEGLRLVRQNTPALIILDIMLPGGMNGFDVLEILKKDKNLKAIPVVVLTNLATEGSVAREIGASDYLVKIENTADVVVEKVKNLLK